MTNVWMRDKRNGQMIQTDDAGAVFRAMRSERDPVSGQTVWEQTGDHHAAAARQRAARGGLREEDLGDFGPPTSLNGPASMTLAPEAAPHKALTPAEIEMGLDEDTKAEQELEMFARAQTHADSNQLDRLKERGEFIEPWQLRRAQALREAAPLIASDDPENEVDEDDDPNPELDGGAEVDDDKGKARPRRGQRGRQQARSGGDAPREDSNAGPKGDS